MGDVLVGGETTGKLHGAGYSELVMLRHEIFMVFCDLKPC